MKRLMFVFGLILPFMANPLHAQQPKIDGLKLYSSALQYYGPQGNLRVHAPGATGTWWRNSHWIKTLDLTPEQQTKIDGVFQQYRLKLIDLNATLLREEAVLAPLIDDVRPEDEARILEQIDRVAQSRAELEKSNARMLLGIRQILTPEQWNKLPALNAWILKSDVKPALKLLK